MEERWYREKTNDHNDIEGPILKRIEHAKFTIAACTKSLNEDLLP